LRRIVCEVGAPPSAVLFIGDSMPDYQAAVQIGVAFVGRVPVGAPSPFPPSQQFLVHDLDELEAWWSKHARPGSGFRRG